jgi:hypothetical protein
MTVYKKLGKRHLVAIPSLHFSLLKEAAEKRTVSCTLIIRELIESKYGDPRPKKQGSVVDKAAMDAELADLESNSSMLCSDDADYERKKAEIITKYKS